MKTKISEDFYPTPETIKALIAWGAEEKNPCGDKLIDQEFITKKSIRLEFIDYWLNVATPPQNKKSNWQTTYRNYIKKIAWPNHVREFENNRHRRTDCGQDGFKSISDINPPIEKEKPITRNWKLPTAPPNQSGPTNPTDAFAELRARGLL